MIRLAVAEDAGGIARVYLESAEQHAVLDPERYEVRAFETIATRYRDGRQHPWRAVAATFVAELDGEIAGFVDVRLERPQDGMHRDAIYCLIAEIAVSSSERGKGIGEQLMRTAEDWGRDNGAEFAYLDYNVANSRAAKFYRERLGYRVASITAVKRL